MQQIKLIAQQIRIHHWIKNLIIFLPVFFAGKLNDWQLVSRSVLIFISFSLAAGFVYCVNDLFDKANDKKHPSKKLRPLAAGKLSSRQVLMLAFVCLLISVVILSSLKNWSAGLAIIIYLTINLTYTLGLKNIAIVDIFLLAINYLIRLYVGATVTNITISVWLFTTILFGSFVLIFGKRYAEFKNNAVRKVLQFYTAKFLDSLLIVSLTITITAFVFYSIAQGSAHIPHIVLFSFIMFRYYYLIQTTSQGEQPEYIFISDPFLFGSLLLFALLSAYSVYV